MNDKLNIRLRDIENENYSLNQIKLTKVNKEILNIIVKNN